jgi:hypothetical protein
MVTRSLSFMRTGIPRVIVLSPSGRQGVAARHAESIRGRHPPGNAVGAD